MSRAAETTEPGPRPGRVLGLDLGERRIGVAVSDDQRRLATPLTVVARAGGNGPRARADDHRRILDEVVATAAVAVVVGLPLSLSGALGPAATAVLEESEQFRAAVASRGLAVEVTTCDERFTTVTAAASLRERGRKPGSARGRADRQVVDQLAAAVMLQSWLDQQRSIR